MRRWYVPRSDPSRAAIRLIIHHRFLLLRPFYFLYLRAALPALAWLITRDRKAYQYLGSSIHGFPDRRGLTKEFLEAGFDKVKVTALTGAIVALHSAEKSASG